MYRRLWVGLLLMGAGCHTTTTSTSTSTSTSKAPPLPAGPVVPPMEVNGAQVIVTDLRPDWERTPSNGTVSVYDLNQLTPNPWALMADETRATVSGMSDKPERVEIQVTSYRLVRRAAPYLRKDRSENVRPAGQSIVADSPTRNTNGQPGSDAPVATSEAVWESLGFGTRRKDPGSPGDPTEEHPVGVSCKIRANVRITYPGGREQTLQLEAFSAGENTSGSKYWGETIAKALRGASSQYGFRFRQQLGVEEAAPVAAPAPAPAQGPRASP